MTVMDPGHHSAILVADSHGHKRETCQYGVQIRWTTLSVKQELSPIQHKKALFEAHSLTTLAMTKRWIIFSQDAQQMCSGRVEDGAKEAHWMWKVSFRVHQGGGGHFHCALAWLDFVILIWLTSDSRKWEIGGPVCYLESFGGRTKYKGHKEINKNKRNQDVFLPLGKPTLSYSSI